MKRSLKKILGYTLKAKDGKKGKIKDVLFDEENWKVRYIHADLGSVIFKGKKVLISNTFFEKEINYDNREFSVDLTLKQIEKAPGIEEDLPVSRVFEKKLNEHYKIADYWLAAPQVIGTVYPPRPLKIPTSKVKEKQIDTSLRSLNEMIGYQINAEDGKFGRVYDCIADDEDWQIVYLIVDTSQWMPWSKKLMLPVNWLKEINYTEQQICTEFRVDTIKDAPEYDEFSNIALEDEVALYDYFNKTH